MISRLDNRKNAMYACWAHAGRQGRWAHSQAAVHHKIQAFPSKHVHHDGRFRKLQLSFGLNMNAGAQERPLQPLQDFLEVQNSPASGWCQRSPSWCPRYCYHLKCYNLQTNNCLA